MNVKHIFLFVFVFAFISIPVKVFSQFTEPDSLLIKENDSIPQSDWTDENDSIEVYYYTSNLYNLKLNRLTYIDTTITETHQYDNLYKGNKLYSTLSNIGDAHISLNFEPDITKGYSKSLFYFNRYLITNDEIKYYKLSKPYTEIFYEMGAKKEQQLQVIFSRDIYNGLNIGLDFTFENSPGIYKNTKTNNMNGYFNVQYVTPNKRYRVIGNYLINKLRIKENGGLVDDNYFTEDLEKDRQVIPVNLSTANNQIKETGVYLQQQFNLTGAKKINDSISNTLDFGSLNYEFQYKKNTYTFSDDEPLADFYANYSPPIDSAKTFDSTAQVFITNKIGWTSLGYAKEKKEKPFYLYGNFTYDIIKEQLPYDSLYSMWHQTGIEGGLGVNIKNSFYLNSEGYLYFTGFNQGDFGIKGSINQYIGNVDKNYGELILSLDFLSKTPLRFYRIWNSNRFRWNNSLSKETYLILSGNYKFKFLNAGIDFYTIGNYTYLNDSVIPYQVDKALTILKFNLGGIIRIGKFGFDTKLVYQKTSKPEAIRIPDFAGALNVFFRKPVFKNAATLQTGIQFRYFTRFYANGYMPELRAFYIQNNVEIGNYLWADVYLTMKIQRARIFVKMSNITGYFEGYNYFLAPHYPDRDPRYYFGVSWRFHD